MGLEEEGVRGEVGGREELVEWGWRKGRGVRER